LGLAESLLTLYAPDVFQCACHFFSMLPEIVFHIFPTDIFVPAGLEILFDLMKTFFFVPLLPLRLCVKNC
jgi:hypothetical protein